jgi:hypothetical protein
MNRIELSLARAPRHPWIAAVASLAAFALLAACDGGSLGDRCNPDLSHDECGSGLACTTPPTCVISVCCPTSGASDDPNCACITNPAGCACTVGDAGASASAADANAE